jgi:RNA recognition motif-containing protein
LVLSRKILSEFFMGIFKEKDEQKQSSGKFGSESTDMTDVILQKRTVYVANLNAKFSKDNIQKFFAQFGTLTGLTLYP